MRRYVVAFSVVALGVACGNDGLEGLIAASPPSSRTTAGAASSSASSASSSGESVAYRRCTHDETSCGLDCCRAGTLCLFHSCVVPGIRCVEDGECPSGRYCETSLARCLPRPPICADLDASDYGFWSKCLDPACGQGRSLVEIRPLENDCGIAPFGVSIANLGPQTLPAGLPVHFVDPDEGDRTVLTTAPLIGGESRDIWVEGRFDRGQVSVDTNAGGLDDCADGGRATLDMQCTPPGTP